ncbi:hypothetical protein CQY20_01205 [Mycolicibacterium agri]|uniref:FUSC family protein n=1 Tax=Mycolicibacterium agri TaxID=36811 RepID=A0A2A7NFD3_MYCAG|nr:hypothetical protein [Mycolicibacterium agri]PEG42644.1 hypothetical protein CQY20_01205 [Mycolicibacterium agri]GFG52618.1 hypothetical protein MAGR_40590 [Mycolicibacterium agri]
MTSSEEGYSSTRPISVAELLARNGTIGAPPVGGRRRRRRGNSDAVTVAELTGEIPVVSGNEDHTDSAEASTDTLEEVRDDRDDHDERNDYGADCGASRNGTTHVDEDIAHADTENATETTDVDAPAVTDEEADYAEHLEKRDAEPMYFEPPRRRPQFGQRRFSSAVDAEEMSPDPVDIDDEDAVDAVAADLGLTRPAMAATKPDTDTDDDQELPSYLRSSGGTLFGGDSVADDLARRGSTRLDDLEFGASDTHVDEEEAEEDEEYVEESTMSSFARGALVVGQCIIAVLFGAGLFIAFDQLWKWNNIVALVLSVLVILGLVVGVRVVRKTEDIGSTLIAVAVGALVTLGPLALLQSG